MNLVLLGRKETIIGKGHKDNHKARLKRGSAAFEKKASRRKKESKCSICGGKCRKSKLVLDTCPICLKKI